MAEKKYSMLLVDNKKFSDQPPKPQPWYKERIQIKYIQAHRSLALDSAQWNLFNSNPDDFREGYPSHRQSLVRGETSAAKLTLPIITEDTCGSAKSHNSSADRTHYTSSFTKNDVLYSKKTPAQNRRINHLTQIETLMEENAFRLHPHYKEAIPAKLYSKYSHLLMEPDDWHYAADSTHNKQNTAGLFERKDERTRNRNIHSINNVPTDGVQTDQNIIGKLYTFSKSPQNNTNSRPASSRETQVSNEYDDNCQLSQVTEDLCSWANSLSNADSPMEPAHVRSLFATTLENNKLNKLTPVQVVDLASIPGELNAALIHSDINKFDAAKQGRKRNPNFEAKSFITSINNKKETSNKRKQRVKYGEWYIPVAMWKALPADKHLDIHTPEEELEKKREAESRAEDFELSQLHSAVMFRKYLEEKQSTKQKTRIPQYLEFTLTATENS